MEATGGAVAQPSGRGVQLKRSLRGLDFAAQEAALAPAQTEAVQRKPVQCKVVQKDDDDEQSGDGGGTAYGPPEASEAPPEPSAEAPEQSAEAPEQSAEAPEQSSETPEQSAETPEQSAETPEQSAETPEQSAETPEQSAETPEQSAETPEQSAETPEQSTETPEQSSETPEQSENPEQSETPEGEGEGTAEGAENGYGVCESPDDDKEGGEGEGDKEGEPKEEEEPLAQFKAECGGEHFGWSFNADSSGGVGVSGFAKGPEIPVPPAQLCPGVFLEVKPEVQGGFTATRKSDGVWDIDVGAQATAAGTVRVGMPHIASAGAGIFLKAAAGFKGTIANGSISVRPPKAELKGGLTVDVRIDLAHITKAVEFGEVSLLELEPTANGYSVHLGKDAQRLIARFQREDQEAVEKYGAGVAHQGGYNPREDHT